MLSDSLNPPVTCSAQSAKSVVGVFVFAEHLLERAVRAFGQLR